MQNNEQSVKEIKAIMKAWGEAFYRKDLDAMFKDHADSYYLHDVKQTAASLEDAKKLWQSYLPFFDQPKEQYKDLAIHACEDMAFVHFKCRVIGTVEPLPDGVESPWLRGTACYRKINAQWKCVHEHISLPVDS